MAGLVEDISGRSGVASPDGRFPRANELRRTEFDGIAYVCPTWDQMGAYSFALARQIIESGQSFDRIVALARGGWTWSRYLVDALQVPELSSMRIISYTGVNESRKPKIVQPLRDRIRGERVLLLDEVADSGDTLEVALGNLRKKKPQTIQTATLCSKPRSKIRPDYSAFETDAWVAFPHEPREFVQDCVKKWKPAGLSIDEVRDRMITIGIDPGEANFYLKLSWS